MEVITIQVQVSQISGTFPWDNLASLCCPAGPPQELPGQTPAYTQAHKLALLASQLSLSCSYSGASDLKCYTQDSLGCYFLCQLRAVKGTPWPIHGAPMWETRTMLSGIHALTAPETRVHGDMCLNPGATPWRSQDPARPEALCPPPPGSRATPRMRSVSYWRGTANPRPCSARVVEATAFSRAFSGPLRLDILFVLLLFLFSLQSTESRKNSSELSVSPILKNLVFSNLKFAELAFPRVGENLELAAPSALPEKALSFKTSQLFCFPCACYPAGGKIGLIIPAARCHLSLETNSVGT